MELPALIRAGTVPSRVGPPGPAQAALRLATADIHEALHRHPAFSGLMRSDLTFRGYASLLGRLWGFHAPLERSLRTGPDPLAAWIDLEAREKAYLLRADLGALGMSNAEIDALPVCETLPPMQSPDNVVGCLYVLEGAGLGGAVLARKLDCHLGRDNPAGRRFFVGRPDPDPMPWPAFCRLLEAFAEQGDLAQIACGARRTFHAMALWLNRDDGHV